MWIIYLSIGILFLTGLIFLCINRHEAAERYKSELKTNKEILKQYVPLNEITNEMESIKTTILADEKFLLQLDKKIALRNKQVETLNNSIALLNDEDYLHECGFYKMRYDFDNTIKFERKLKEIRAKQKKMIQDKSAVSTPFHTEMNGSESQGKAFINKLRSLILQSFNGECDAAVTKVDYKNIVNFEARIEQRFDRINKSFDKYSVKIVKEYLQLKISELRLVHEFQEKKEEEKEEQRRIKEIMRDELKAEKEIEKAQANAEREEQRYLEALAQARDKAETATGRQQEVLLQKIKDLTGKLEIAQENRARAISRAQMTKSGYVYVISNIGSFGENVFKVGMTRRLEPMDRVKELGDASVPFAFDVHAMIFSENAPKLEKQLHQALAKNQVNKVNARKEFFRAPITEIEKVAKKHQGDLKLTKIAEAKEFRQTVAIEKNNKKSQTKIESPPDTFNIACESCGQSLEVEKEWIGLETTCPMCKNKIIISNNSI